MNLGENIHEFRVKRNLSQGDLANVLDVSRQSVSKWENNSAQPELDKLVKMSKLFDVTLDELVFGKKEVPPQDTNLPGSARLHWPTRVIAGTVMMLFGMVFFLLSLFWGNYTSLNEEVGEFIGITIMLLSISMVATYHKGILAICGVVYAIYGVACYGVMNVTNMMHYLFMFVTGIVLLVWFIIWGLNAEKQAQNA